jgi:protease IV
MKIIHESIFMNALRAFFIAFFGVLGVAVAVLAIIFAFYGVFKSTDDQTFSSSVKLLPDADGNRKKLSSNTPILLQITIDGEIGKDKLTGKKIEEILLDSREEAFSNDRVKGIFLVINSPGGGVNDSDIIYRHLKEYKERYQIPIYAFVDGLCASGGYYIACASDKIYASDVSLIGSVGVLSWPPFMNLVDAMEKVGINSMTLSAGKGKDKMNPFRPWQEGEQDHYQTLIDFFYNQFVAVVTKDRPIDADQLEGKLGAEVFPAPKALENGLIDESGATRSQVIRALARDAGIEGKYQVVGFDTTSWLKTLIKEESHSPLFSGKIKHEFALPIPEGNPFYYR